MTTNKILNEKALTATLDWYLAVNPIALELMIKNPKQFILDALEAEQKYLAEFVSNENKMNAFVEYIAPQVFAKLNNN